MKNIELWHLNEEQMLEKMNSLARDAMNFSIYSPEDRIWSFV
ncbi:MAG: hypothetical protein OXH82_03550 [Candidatus Dadabacteria bacterium]|nr:hypothetical protein [Candidatus Dadabacteria bacterium]MDE0662987.1 hypothetical protein [Candidatus Dadabacteria bacterium]